MGKVIAAILLVASLASAQYFPPGGGGGGSGTVTSVGLAGTANQITVTGTSPITGSGSWTLSFPAGGVTLPGTTTGTFTGNLTGNATGSAGSVAASGVTAGAFAAGAYTVPTGGSLTVSGSGTINATSVGGTTPTAFGLSLIDDVAASNGRTTLGVVIGTDVVGFGGALGTPSSGTATNITGLPAAGVVGTAAILGANTFTGQQIISLNGAASTPPLTLTGTIFTGGSATTTKPQLLIEPTGATSTAWSTSGTLYGGNSASGFTGNLIDLQVNGVSRFSVNANTQVALAGGFSGTTSLTTPLLNTITSNATLTINSGNFSTASRFAVTMGTGTHSQTSGTNGALTILPTYNQASGTAANKDLYINRTETAVGSGTQHLIDAAVGGSSKFSVDTAGLITSISATLSGSAITLSGLGASTGTPDSICINTNTVTRNAALTCTVSSENVKSHFAPLPDADFMALRPLAFEYNDRPGRVRWGFGAQQVASVNPALADGWRADGQPWSLDQNAILALTVKVVQDLTAEVEQLKRR